MNYVHTAVVVDVFPEEVFYVSGALKLFIVLVGLRLAHRLFVISLKKSTGVMFGRMNRPILRGGGRDIFAECNPTGGVISL